MKGKSGKMSVLLAPSISMTAACVGEEELHFDISLFLHRHEKESGYEEWA
jgi:hypothetical protein